MIQSTFAPTALCLALVLYTLLVFLPGATAMGAEQEIQNERGVSVGAQAKEDNHIKWYKKKLDGWQFQTRVLRIFQTALAALAILSAVYASSKLKTPKRLPEALIPFVAAVSIALLTGLDLNAQANKLRTAWRTLSVAVREYEETGGKKDIGKVREAYARAEAAIGDYKPGPK